MISPHAIIDPAARIAKNVSIGPFSVIGGDVEIAAGTEIGSHVVIKGITKIGANNKFYQFSSIGEDCQDKKYNGEPTVLNIGNNNIFREGCTIHRGTEQGGGETVIGDYNLFMVNSHVAHDCYIGNHVTFSNGATIAGHVIVGDYASLGGLVGVHQFCRLGAHSFAAGGSIIYKDVMPYVKVCGFPAKVFGLNSIGLERRNFTQTAISKLQKAYRIVFRTSYTVSDAVQSLLPMVEQENDNIIELFVNFLQDSTRGIVR